jgi:2-methylisocitrate lyase-like PEP mutase family enzyme
MNPRTRLQNLLERDSVAYLPGVHDALSATIAAHSPVVDGLQHSGYGTSASLLGYPDLNFTSLKETTDVVRNMVRAAGETPVLVDADTGYGGIANLHHTVRELEHTGAAGLFIEDQSVPKQCGLMEGKELIDPERMAGKLRAAIDARRNEDFAILARTDAYGEAGLEEAIRRGQRYAAAGADAFLLGDPIPLAEIEQVVSAVDIPYYALGIHSDDADFQTWRTFEEYDEAGVSLVCDVGGLLQVAVAAMEEYMQAMDADGAFDREYEPLADLTAFLGAEEYRAFEDRFTPS